MGGIFTLLGIAVTAVIASILLKREGAHWGIILSGLADISQIGSSWLSPLLKIVGVAFLGEWGVQLCKDAGENAIAVKLEMGVKIVLLVLCIPLISQLLSLITSILNGGI